MDGGGCAGGPWLLFTAKAQGGLVAEPAVAGQWVAPRLFGCCLRLSDALRALGVGARALEVEEPHVVAARLAAAVASRISLEYWIREGLGLHAQPGVGPVTCRPMWMGLGRGREALGLEFKIEADAKGWSPQGMARRRACAVGVRSAFLAVVGPGACFEWIGEALPDDEVRRIAAWAERGEIAQALASCSGDPGEGGRSKSL